MDVFTYRQGKIIFFLLFVISSPGVCRSQRLKKYICLNACLHFFFGAESSINALGVAQLNS